MIKKIATILVFAGSMALSFAAQAEVKTKGEAWSVTAQGGWTGTWNQLSGDQPGIGTFSCPLTRGNTRITATCIMSKASNNRVLVKMRNMSNNDSCDFEGIREKNNINDGSYFCQNTGGRFEWSALITPGESK